jgi:hypothetical protein
VDLLSRKTTADLFYTNDVKVLIDIVVRNIADLSPGDKVPRPRQPRAGAVLFVAEEAAVH